MLLGAQNAWADITLPNGYGNNTFIYFDNTLTGWTSGDDAVASDRHVYFVFGNDGAYCQCIASAISNTKLYLWSGGSDWGTIKYVCWFNGTWGESKTTESAYSNISGNAGDLNYTDNNIQTYEFKKNAFNLITPSKETESSKKWTQNISWLTETEGYSILNKAQTVAQASTTDGSTFTAPSNSLADITVNGYAFTANSTCGAFAAGSIAEGSEYAVVEKSAGYTSTITLAISNVNGYYIFIGWHDGTSIVSTATSYSYDVKEAKTITARFIPSSVSKAITDAGWATYCSPFALDFSGDIADLADVYIVTGGTAGTGGEDADGILSMTSVKGGTVAANTGLLLKGTEGIIDIPVVASGTNYSTTNKLVGVTTNTAIDPNAGYVLMASPSLGFYMNSKTFNVGANTAYLPSNFDGSETAPARFRIEEEENNATDIHAIEANGTAIKFIENGKLLIMREGVVYDATGRVIR